MIVTRPVKGREPDLLLGHERLNLIIVDGSNGNTLENVIAPREGWTHDSLEQFADSMQYPWWDAYLGGLDQWIGSSEV